MHLPIDRIVHTTRYYIIDAGRWLNIENNICPEISPYRFTFSLSCFHLHMAPRVREMECRIAGSVDLQTRNTYCRLFYKRKALLAVGTTTPNHTIARSVF